MSNNSRSEKHPDNRSIGDEYQNEVIHPRQSIRAKLFRSNECGRVPLWIGEQGDGTLVYCESIVEHLSRHPFKQTRDP